MDTSNDLDWMNKYRLRLELLPQNPFFRRAVAQVRDSLGLPSLGFTPDLDLGHWLVANMDERIGRWASFSPPPGYEDKVHPRWKEQPATIALHDSETWFKEGRLAWHERNQIEELQVCREAARLVSNFGLPPSARPQVAWHVLTNEAVPPRMETIFAEQFELGSSSGEMENAIDQEINEWVLDGFPEGIPGTVVVIRLLVNDYTTKKDFVSQAWGKVQQIRDDKYPERPSRRRSVSVTKQLYEDWLPGYLAHRVEERSLDQVASDEGIEEVETLRYRIEQLDDLFARPKE